MVSLAESGDSFQGLRVSVSGKTLGIVFLRECFYSLLSIPILVFIRDKFAFMRNNSNSNWIPILSFRWQVFLQGLKRADFMMPLALGFYL